MELCPCCQSDDPLSEAPGHVHNGTIEAERHRWTTMPMSPVVHAWWMLRRGALLEQVTAATGVAHDVVALWSSQQAVRPAELQQRW